MGNLDEEGGVPKSVHIGSLPKKINLDGSKYKKKSGVFFYSLNLEEEEEDRSIFFGILKILKIILWFWVPFIILLLIIEFILDPVVEGLLFRDL